jgi:hypothetical protein
LKKEDSMAERPDFENFIKSKESLVISVKITKEKMKMC